MRIDLLKTRDCLIKKKRYPLKKQRPALYKSRALA